MCLEEISAVGPKKPFCLYFFQAYAVQGQHAIPQPDVSAVNILTPPPLLPIITTAVFQNVLPPTQFSFISLQL